MAVDTEYLRKHYASLSDDALLEINPGDLVPAARQCFDAEVERRQLESPDALYAGGEADAEQSGEELPSDSDDDAEWLEDAAEVYSVAVRPGVALAPDAANAREALKDAGIPCRLELFDEEPYDEPPPAPGQRWRLMVPDHLSLQATGVIQRDIFNDDFEAGWRTRLEVLSDSEVRALDPRMVFCGIFDQIERVNRVYREELARRGLSS